MAKIWQKKASGTNELSQKVEKFTVGNDREADLKLAKYDVLGSLAHCKMLNDIKLLTKMEYQAIKKHYKPFTTKSLKEILVFRIHAKTFTQK